MHTRKIAIPSVSLINSAFEKYDFADCYKIEFCQAEGLTVDTCLPAVFNCPAWINALLTLRNWLVKPFGLKTSDEDEPEIPERRFYQGDDLGVFSVLERNEKEILLGIFDKHLDAGIAVMLDTSADKYDLILATIVQYNNFFGKTYFFIIRPFHKLIVRTLLKRAVVYIQTFKK